MSKTAAATHTDVRADILSVPFHMLRPDEALARLLGYLRGDGNRLVMTPNPEGVMQARRNADFRRALLDADLLLADGIGILWASRVLRRGLKTRVRGLDLAYALLARVAAMDGVTVYFLGAAPGVAAAAKTKMEALFPGLVVVGVHDGYFDAKEESIIIDEINALKPAILFVCMGMPRQELWARANRDLLPVKITLCLGGTLDVMGGAVKKAPDILRRIGLEWLYRLATQPHRFRRMLDLPRFVGAVLREKWGCR